MTVSAGETDLAVDLLGHHAPAVVLLFVDPALKDLIVKLDTEVVPKSETKLTEVRPPTRA